MSRPELLPAEGRRWLQICSYHCRALGWMESCVDCMRWGSSVPSAGDVEQSPRVPCALNFNTVLSPLHCLSSFPAWLLQQDSSLFPCPSLVFFLLRKLVFGHAQGGWRCSAFIRPTFLLLLHETHQPSKPPACACTETEDAATTDPLCHHLRHIQQTGGERLGGIITIQSVAGVLIRARGMLRKVTFT